MANPVFKGLGFNNGAPTSPQVIFRGLGFNNSYKIPFPLKFDGLGFNNAYKIPFPVAYRGAHFESEELPPFEPNHWRILYNDVHQVDLDNTDHSYFEHSSWSSMSTLWFQLEILAEGYTTPRAFFEFVTKQRRYTFKVSATQLVIPGPSETTITQNFSAAFIPIKVRVDGADGSLTVWVDEEEVHTGFRPNVLDFDGNRLAYGKLDTTPVTGGTIAFDYVREYYDLNDVSAPWDNTYEADFDPDDMRADPSWVVTNSSLFTTSGGVLTIDGNQAGIYYMEMDTSIRGHWDADSVGVIEMESQLAANAGLYKWGMEFRVGTQHVLLFMGYNGTTEVIQTRSSLGGAVTEYVTPVSDSYHVWRFICDYLHDKFTVEKDGDELFSIPFYTDSNSGEVVRIGCPVGGSATPGKNWSIKNVRWMKVTPIYSVYDSAISIEPGWNKMSFDPDYPDLEVNNPIRAAIGRVGWRVCTNSVLDVLVDPAVDQFGTDETEHIAKIDTYLNDGTLEFEPRVISYGDISKALSGRVGSYELADFEVKIENVTGWGSKVFTDHNISLINTPYEVNYGLKDEFWEDFHTLFRGVVSDIQFDGFTMGLKFTDPMPRYFNRLPNQYVTSDSFPSVADDFAGSVAAIIAGTVETDTGALKVTPVDWAVEITDGSGSKPQNDKIDFKYKPFGGSLTTYAVTLTSGVYTDPAALATEVETRMNAAMGSPPGDPGFDVTFDTTERKLQIEVIKGGELTLQWSEGANASINAADALGFDKDQDKSGSKKVKSDRKYWNKFVVARHWCKEDSNAKLWIEEDYIGDKDSQQVNFTFDHVTADSLKWTLVHTPYKTVGDSEARVNISGLTDDESPSGTLVTDPVDFLEIVLSRFVELPVSLLDNDSFVAAKVFTVRNSYQVAGAVTQDVEWTTFIEEYCYNFRMDVWLKNNGKIACGFFETTVNDPDARHITDIVDILDGSYKYSTEFTSIINKIRYEFKKDYVTDAYLLSSFEDDQSSIQRTKQVYEWPEGTLQLNWIRDIVTAQRVVAATINLFSEANPIVTMEIPFTGQFEPVDLTDKLNITTAQGPFYDAATNIRGYTNRLHRVIEVAVDINDYKMDIKLQDMFRLSYNCFFLGDDTWDTDELDWLTANEENQQTYGYLCDEASGQFSNGDPGKRLC